MIASLCFKEKMTDATLQTQPLPLAQYTKNTGKRQNLKFGVGECGERQAVCDYEGCTPAEWHCSGGCASGVIEQQEPQMAAGSNREFDSTGQAPVEQR